MDRLSSGLYLSDLDTAISNCVGMERFDGSTILLTGATGTIGSFLADMLLRYSATRNAGIRVILAGRDPKKLERLYAEMSGGTARYVYYDVEEPVQLPASVDYILHAAGNAHPKAFNADPVGTLVGSVLGTYRLLEYGRYCGARRFLYVSSGEVYGRGDEGMAEFEETYAGYVDALSSRSCYPTGKRAAENLCAAYTGQFGTQTVIVRPCHTYGPRFTASDSRAHVQFIRNVINDEDIVLKSAGTQMRSYIYVADCASAMLTALSRGQSGEAYNIANAEARITIAGFAQTLAEVSGKRVVFALPDEEDMANRTPIPNQVLSSRKIEALGWRGSYTVKRGIEHTLRILQGE